MTRTSLLRSLLGFLAIVVGVVAFAGSSAGMSSGFAGGDAIEVPGAGALNAGGNANVNSISCTAAGECAAGGPYKDGSNNRQAFVVSEKKGVWGSAVAVPGLSDLNAGGGATLNVVSCASAGQCAAGGYYEDGSFNDQAFLVSEKNGVWGTAVEVPGTAVLNSGNDASLRSVSCAAAGECAAGGYYADGSGKYQAFVVDEKNGVWGSAVEAPGTAALNAGGDADVNAVSCPAVGACSATGYYKDGSGGYQAFVAREKGGVWGPAVEIPGLAALNVDGNAYGGAVSCSAAGECAAGGFYTDGSGKYETFVVSEKKGVWHDAVEVPGIDALNTAGNSNVGSISCAGPGACAVVGWYYTAQSEAQAWVATEKKGVWGSAVEVPGTAALNVDNFAVTESVSCPAVGECALSGRYRDGSSDQEAFVANQHKGVWGAAIEVPGTAALAVRGLGDADAISCGAPGVCAAGGGYYDASVHHQAFVVDGAAPCVVPHVVGKTLAAGKKAIAAAYCRVGRIKKAYAKTKKGRIAAQKPKPGTTLRNGSKVALTVSRGAKS